MKKKPQKYAVFGFYADPPQIAIDFKTGRTMLEAIRKTERSRGEAYTPALAFTPSQLHVIAMDLMEWDGKSNV